MGKPFPLYFILFIEKYQILIPVVCFHFGSEYTCKAISSKISLQSSKYSFKHVLPNFKNMFTTYFPNYVILSSEVLSIIFFVFLYGYISAGQNVTDPNSQCVQCTYIGSNKGISACSFMNVCKAFPFLQVLDLLTMPSNLLL